MNFTLPYEQYLDIYRYKYLALYHALRSAILDGTLPGGTRLLSTRKLAGLYLLSRGSASQVYDMLLADGYIRTERGRGAFVSEGGFLGDDDEGQDAGSLPFVRPGVERDGYLKAGSSALRENGGSEAEAGGSVTGNGGGSETEAGSAAPGNSGGSETEAGSASTLVSVGLTAEGVSGYGSGPAAAGPVKLSAWGERLMERQLTVYERTGDGFISFRSSGMQAGQFPYAEWRSALNYAGGKQGGLLDSYCPPQGDEGLRRSIAAHLRITRGIRAEAGQIVLFSGSMQGIMILTQLLLEQGSSAVVEDPGYHGIRRAVEISGGRLLPGRVDAEGLVPEDWAARLLFVTPSRQFPTGAVLPLERRRWLLEWARRHEAVIIEDDYDSEFRWGGRPIEPLKALDREERVVYVGSFSNSMFFGLRVGFAVLPASLAAPVIAAKALYEPLPAGQLEQRALARFMSTGGYGRHLRRMTRIYGERARLLRTLLTVRLGGVLEVLPGDAGLHLYARWLRSDAEFAAFRAAALRRGTDFRDAVLYRIRAGSAAACFSFAHLDAAALEEGVSRLLQAWNDVQNLP
ncbi:PLP-dependent aminotransferase family protein [Paenibacillus camerounensis]|uniref:aminotransferase-like domain-containing protein n=1 Tax=Paenibacillus camerounensis TaxID=1243663 RepID=UPI0005AB34ED|nr:PLP-dependent aminotransferase family protein [Paenibacillus camerounensis]